MRRALVVCGAHSVLLGASAKSTLMDISADDPMLSSDFSLPVEVASGATAHLPEAPTQLAASGRRLHVLFQGFQQLSVRPEPPPYVRRHRLWPAGESAGSSAITRRSAGQASPTWSSSW